MANTMDTDELIISLKKPLPSLGTLLKEGRARHKLKQTELAAKSHLTPAEVSRIESDTTKKPSIEILKALAPYVGLSFNQLLLLAGYSGDDNLDLYYNYNGDIIDHLKIVDDIYFVDPELLELLENIKQLSFEEIKLLKRFIQVSSILSKSDNKSGIIYTLFISLKKYIIEQLEIILKFFQ